MKDKIKGITLRYGAIRYVPISRESGFFLFKISGVGLQSGEKYEKVKIKRKKYPEVDRQECAILHGRKLMIRWQNTKVEYYLQRYRRDIDESPEFAISGLFSLRTKIQHKNKTKTFLCDEIVLKKGIQIYSPRYFSPIVELFKKIGWLDENKWKIEAKKILTGKTRIPLLVERESYDKVKAWADIFESNRGSNINIVMHCAVSIPSNKQIIPIQIPPNTKWEDITIKFINEGEVRISTEKTEIKANYKEMGFEDKRRRFPNKQWKLLQLLASSKGQLDWKNSDANFDIKKKKQLLSQALKVYFQIKTDPFFSYKQFKAYRIRINLISD